MDSEKKANQKQDQEKRSKNGASPDAPLDLHPDWLRVVRAAQAACKSNNGFGVMTIIVSTMGSVPIFWEPVLRHKLHPARAASVQMSPETAGALMALMDRYVDEPVIIPEDKLT